MEKTYIALENISKTFPDGSVLLDKINYKFYYKNMYLIKSKSGLGKTTLLTIISGLEKSTSGKVIKKGFLDKNPFSYLFTDHMSFLGLTGRQNIEIVSKNKILLNDLASKLGILELLDFKVDTYSKGELARLELIRVLLLDKPIILLDEPTGNLDSENTNKVFEVLDDYKKDKLIICVSHDFSSSELETLEIKNKKLNEINRVPIIKKSLDVTNKTKKIINFKYFFNFILKIYKMNYIKIIFLFILTTILIFSTYIYNSKVDFDQKSIELLNENNIGFVDTKIKTEYSYIDFTYLNNGQVFDCLLSPNNTFNINNKKYLLNDSSIIVSSEYINTDLDLKNLEIKGYLDTTPSYSLISLDTASAYFESKGFTVDINDIKELNTIISKSDFDYLQCKYNFSYSESLKDNEVNLYCSRDKYASLEELLSPCFNKELTIKSGVLSNYYESIIIKGLIVDETSQFNSIKMESSKDFYDKVKTDTYNLISSVYPNDNVISSDYFDQMEFKDISLNRNVLKNVSVNQDIISFLSLYKSCSYFFSIYFIYLVVFYLIYTILLVFIISSIDRSFRYDKNLLRVLDFSRINCILIYFFSFLFVCIISLLISTVIFNLSSLSINNFVFKKFLDGPSFINLFKISFPTISLTTLFIALSISIVYSKNNKNFSLSLKTNKE